MWPRWRSKKAFPRWCGSSATKLAEELAAEGRCADLVLGNNVLAQVPDLNDFVEGLKILLKPDGVLTLEFPHLLRLIEHNEFDTIYHEHFSYFSMLTTITHPGGSRPESVRRGRVDDARRLAARLCLPSRGSNAHPVAAERSAR